jgi:DNA-binding NarL/FixJ family response regulator
VSLARVVIADAHVATRMGLRMAIEAGNFVVVGEASDADGAIRLVQRLEPDLCLLDVSMPGDGVVAAGAIHRTVPSTRIIMVTASEDDGDVFGALLAGAVGLVNKNVDPDHLPRALRAVMEGEAAFSRQVMLRIINEFRSRDSDAWTQPPTRPGNVGLTEREWQILKLLGSGHSTADIAAELFVTPITVRSHIASALHKLRVSDRESALKLIDGASRARQY